MSFYSSTDFKRHGPELARTTADKFVLVKNPLKTDNWAAFIAKVIASADIDSTDFSFANVGEELRMTVAAQSGVDPSGSVAVGDNLCHALLDTETTQVLLVVDCVNRDIANGTGDTVTIPAMVYTVAEPVADV